MGFSESGGGLPFQTTAYPLTGISLAGTSARIAARSAPHTPTHVFVGSELFGITTVTTTSVLISVVFVPMAASNVVIGLG